MRLSDASRSLLLVASLLCGAAIAHSAIPYLYHSLPLASLRVETIVDSLRRRDVTPSIVVFGSSVTGSGVDPGALAKAIPGTPTVFNLAAPAQTLAEAVLIYQDLPDAARVVLQELSPWELVTANPFAPNKVNSYYSEGYRPSERTIAILREVFGESTAAALRSSETAQRFRSRWALSRVLDLSFWLNLRTQLEAERTTNDISHFLPEEGRVDDEVLALLVHRWASMFSSPNPEVFATKRRLVKLAVEELRKAGREVIVYVPPIHPRVRTRMTAPFPEWLDVLLETAREAGAHPMSLAAEEPEMEFHDALHLSAGAAARTTQALAQRVIEVGAEPSPAYAGSRNAP